VTNEECLTSQKPSLEQLTVDQQQLAKSTGKQYLNMSYKINSHGELVKHTDLFHGRTDMLEILCMKWKLRENKETNLIFQIYNCMYLQS